MVPVRCQCIRKPAIRENGAESIPKFTFADIAKLVEEIYRERNKGYKFFYKELAHNDQVKYRVIMLTVAELLDKITNNYCVHLDIGLHMYSTEEIDYII